MLLHWIFCICKVDNVTTDKNIVLKIYVGRGGGGKFLNIIKGGLHVFNFYFKGGCKYYYGFLNFQPAPPSCVSNERSLRL